jgi:hypothetical protein
LGTVTSHGKWIGVLSPGCGGHWSRRIWGIGASSGDLQGPSTPPQIMVMLELLELISTLLPPWTVLV